jgi:hypothetical protein
MRRLFADCTRKRRHRHRTAATSLVCGVVLALTGSARAEEKVGQSFFESIGAVNDLLQSPNARDVAWGAFNGGKYHVLSAVPLLTAALGRELLGDAHAKEAAELAILDALIQLEARVPADVLRRGANQWPVPTLILLATATGNRDALLLSIWIRPAASNGKRSRICY